MPDRLESGVGWLHKVRANAMGREVTYRRGELETTLTATRGASVFRLAAEYGVSIRVEMDDYIVTAADLVFGSTPVEPQAGDVIVDELGGVETQFEVRGPGGGEPAWQWDPFHVSYRIHTKALTTP